MSKPVFSDLFAFRSGRRDRRSFGLLVISCFVVEAAIIASIFVPAYFAQQRYLGMAASGQPLPEPADASGLSLILGLAIGVIRLSALAAAIVIVWAAVAQRARDLGWSGWSSLWLLVPLVNLHFLFVFFARMGEPRENRFGPAPRER